MRRGKLSERFGARPDAEAIFDLFVRNANLEGEQARTRRAPAPPMGPSIEATGEADAMTHQSVVFDSNLSGGGGPVPSGHVVLLTRRKKVAVDLDADDTQETPALTEEAARQVVETFESGRSVSVGRVVKMAEPAPVNTQSEEAEAAQVVPDVAKVTPPPPPVPERSEDGQMPAGALDRILTDMTTLLRYGHRPQVRLGLEELVRRYPEDLLLLRRIAEFHLQNDEREGAIEMLFLLAARLFERRNVTGMRQALEQVLVLDPKHRRAYKLLGLLEVRPDTGTG